MHKPHECPKCKSSHELKLIDQRPEYRLDDPHHRRPYATRFTYKCQCGMAFTLSELIEPLAE